MCDTAFWRGMAAGMAAGAIIGMTVAEKRKAMKTTSADKRATYDR